MKYRHVTAERNYARSVLAQAEINLGADFHTLPSSKVDALLTEANRVGYRKPKHANGSRGRYFHDMMQRRATREG